MTSIHILMAPQYLYNNQRGVTPDSLVIDRPWPTRTRAVNVVSSDRLNQHGENNKSKRRQRGVYTFTA